MLNLQKIKWMTKASIYEQKEEKSAFRMNRYFQGDYISYGMIKTAIGVTIAAVLVIGVWVLMHAEELLTMTEYEALISMGIHAVFYYAIAVVIGVCIAFFVYLLRYQKMQQGLRQYVKYLKKIKKIEEQDRKRAGVAQEEEETW